MNIVIINGSIKADSNSCKVSKAFETVLTEKGANAQIADPSPFLELFKGDYIGLENASATQYEIIQLLCSADVLLFVVPSYYRSMPGVLKNFFDIVKCPEIYQNKTIALVAANHKNQDYGAKHAEEVIRAIVVFEKIKATITPEILIVHHEKIDMSEVDRFTKYFL